MVHYQRYYHQLRKGEGGGREAVNGIIGEGDEGDLQTQQLVYGFGHGGKFVNKGYYYYKRATASATRPARLLFLSLLLLLLLLSSLIWASWLLGFCSSSALSLIYSFGAENGVLNSYALPCSSISNGTICCDRSSIRTDICFMKGDIRTHASSSSVLLYTTPRSDIRSSSFNSRKGLTNAPPGLTVPGGEEDHDTKELHREKIKPYTRKWEANTMSTIDELDLVSKQEHLGSRHTCDVVHDVPAVFFSTGGYTGNVYHEFNDGIIPLYITSQHFKRKVVFVVVEYHSWWFTKYGDILSRLSDFPPVDYNGDKRTHCFPEAIVGLRIHDELTVNSSLMRGKKTIRDFRAVLDRAYRPRIRDLIHGEEREEQQKLVMSPSSVPSSPSASSVSLLKSEKKGAAEKPKLVILSRNGSRAITNEDQLVKLAEGIGFQVQVLRPDRTTELAKIYRALNSSDAMIGTHGAAMTHFLFMKPGCVFIQVIPLGTEWAAETYYGEPAKKLGLKYIPYKIAPRESSLYDDYGKEDPVLTDPDSVAKKGWEFVKKTYLDNQNVKLDLRRFRKRLMRAYEYSISKRGTQIKLLDA